MAESIAHHAAPDALPLLAAAWHQPQPRNAAASKQKTSLYIILFPGEARDNTGIKDLNDKVIGQWWNSQFLQKRYDAIESIFSKDGFAVAAQSYKTAFVMTYDKEREDFRAKLTASSTTT